MPQELRDLNTVICADDGKCHRAQHGARGQGCTFRKGWNQGLGTDWRLQAHTQFLVPCVLEWGLVVPSSRRHLDQSSRRICSSLQLRGFAVTTITVCLETLNTVGLCCCCSFVLFGIFKKTCKLEANNKSIWNIKDCQWASERTRLQHLWYSFLL